MPFPSFLGCLSDMPLFHLSALITISDTSPPTLPRMRVGKGRDLRCIFLHIPPVSAGGPQLAIPNLSHSCPLRGPQEYHWLLDLSLQLQPLPPAPHTRTVEVPSAHSVAWRCYLQKARQGRGESGKLSFHSFPCWADHKRGGGLLGEVLRIRRT